MKKKTDEGYVMSNATIAAMTSHTLIVQSTTREQFIDCTAPIFELVRLSQLTGGLCSIFCPHTTAGITLNENSDPDVQADMLLALKRTIPQRGWPAEGLQFRHYEINSDAHLKASLMGASVTIPIVNARMVLGRWQAIYFAEFDGPRDRELIVTLLAG